MNVKADTLSRTVSPHRYLSVIFACLAIFILSGSVFIDHKVEGAANREIINAHDVIQTFRIEGINFLPETSLNPQEFRVKDTEPTIYKDLQGNLLFIYPYSSFVERRENFRWFEQGNIFAFTFEGRSYFSKQYSVKNLELVYSITYLYNANPQAVVDNFKKVNQVIFTDLNAGKEVVFMGDSPSWDVKLSLRYYEHWWTDSDDKLQCDSYNTETTTIIYKGKIPEHPVPMKYSVSAGTDKSYGTQEITPEMLARTINLGVSGSNGLIPQLDSVYKMEITLDGKTEELELKAKSDGS
ncbi:hypothetical protein [Desulfosporosinus sp. BG]|uniref:hypothetical protein n=1 Tax=Desulfosporosinus sp. BG TaxID=1633135 RepID=UPI000839E067|nr:hypothetical protein [Desulfosporosinus sp. BG]ODA42849.1 Oligoendopeptidase F [Desulfosporosinus sp. BG]